jgi:hypothetical protein
VGAQKPQGVANRGIGTAQRCGGTEQPDNLHALQGCFQALSDGSDYLLGGYRLAVEDQRVQPYSGQPCAVPGGRHRCGHQPVFFQQCRGERDRASGRSAGYHVQQLAGGALADQPLGGRQ